MFEDSLMESAGQIPSSNRWTIAGSMLAQAAALAALLLVPILFPQALPRQTMFRLLVAPPFAAVSAAPRLEHRSAAPANTQIAVLNLSRTTTQLSRLSMTRGTETGLAAPDSWIPGESQSGTPNGIPGLESMVVSAPPVRPAPKGPVRVSSGVATGQLIGSIRPVYPPIAIATHVQGTVVVEATISRLGTIENLHVASGPMLLQGAAVRAIRDARYKPFLLSGEPVEVETSISVVFTLGGG